MRIVHVTDTFLPKIGGAEIAIDQLVRAMNAAGEQCSVLAQSPRGRSGTIETPYPLFRFPSPRSSLWAGWWIEQHLKRLEHRFGSADVLIGHHAFPPGYACVKYAKKHGIPSIVYPRGGDIYEVSRFRRKKHAWRRLTWALTHASAVVCASAAMEQIVRDIIGDRAADGRLERIPNGVNTADLMLDASSSRFAADPHFQSPFILGLGRLIHRKGFHLLIDAFSALPATDWKLVIAGDGRELENLKKQASPLADRILFTGLVEAADKRWLLQNCRFMAAPSLEESFGNVALEAMACGRPVIASRASGFAEIIRDEENGRLFNVGDIAALRDTIHWMQKTDLTPQSTAAHDTARDFSWAAITLKYQVLIHRLIRPPSLPGTSDRT